MNVQPPPDSHCAFCETKSAPERPAFVALHAATAASSVLSDATQAVVYCTVCSLASSVAPCMDMAMISVASASVAVVYSCTLLYWSRGSTAKVEGTPATHCWVPGPVTRQNCGAVAAGVTMMVNGLRRGLRHKDGYPQPGNPSTGSAQPGPDGSIDRQLS